MDLRTESHGMVQFTDINGTSQDNNNLNVPGNESNYTGDRGRRPTIISPPSRNERDSPRISWKNLAYEFTQYTTLHGIRHIAVREAFICAFDPSGLCLQCDLLYCLIKGQFSVLSKACVYILTASGIEYNI
ncbi:hypothetical protein ACF0H5_019655 [Mactra antiquata]